MKKIHNKKYIVLADFLLVLATIVPIYILDTFSYIIYICALYFFIGFLYFGQRGAKNKIEENE